MATDLRGIPGASGRRRRGRTRRPRVWSPRRRRSIPWSTLGIAGGFLVLGGFVGQQVWDATRVNVDIAGITDGDHLTTDQAAELRVVIGVDRFDPESGVRPTLFHNGFEAPRDTWSIVGTEIVWSPPPLDEGAHRLSVSMGRPLLDDAEFSWQFTVDGTPPVIDVTSPLPAVPICEAVEVTGRIETGLASVTANGEDLDVAEDGTFVLRFAHPPTSPVVIEAEDRAGNRAAAEVVVPVRYPSTQGMHVTAAAWGYQPLRDHVLELVDAGKVSAVQLDLKDEGGIIGYDSDVALAKEIGAVRPEFVLEEAVDLLHAKGVRVVGRIVAFRDGPLARWAVDNDRMDLVIQNNDGELHPAYGGFSNLANPVVRRYNIDVALEAVDRGVDEILWDYVRRPEGSLDNMVFPGLQIAPGATEAKAINDTVVSFLAEAAGPLREACVYQGASLFGVAARNPDAIGQPVPAIARHVDYIAPMLYPSHWVRGEYRVAHPNGQPYDIVHAALTDFLRRSAGSGVAFTLWVQDFSLGVRYGPAEVRAQIDAARDLGVENWLLWNAGVRYTADAITPDIVTR